jgi:hypothetical protein
MPDLFEILGTWMAEYAEYAQAKTQETNVFHYNHSLRCKCQLSALFSRTHLTLRTARYGTVLIWPSVRLACTVIQKNLDYSRCSESVLIFLVYFGLRIKGLVHHDDSASDLAFDILACAGCVLFPRSVTTRAVSRRYCLTENLQIGVLFNLK